MQDLNKFDLERLSARVKADIDAYCVRTYTQEHREHLGASIIGHECARYIWYAFRWVKLEIFDGRMLRLFDRGHREEDRWVEWLKGAGFTVWQHDANGIQFRIVGAKGHYGGSTDSVGKPPYPDIFEPMLLEFKTHNRGSFSDLINKRLLVSKPRHYAQMCSYGAAFNLKYGMYFAINKDDDDIWIECVPLDPAYAVDLARKAEDIIFAETPPQKIAMEPTFFTCKYCPFQDVCHRGAEADRNCRSCRDAIPIDGGRWHCRNWNDTIPEHVIKTGCDQWRSVA